MSFHYPVMVVVAAVACVALALLYGRLHRDRARTLAAAGLTPPGRSGVRRHVPPALFLAALTLLLFAVARPEATVRIPRAEGTVILTFDVSNSMAAKDVTPTRLAAAQAAATGFVNHQPSTVDDDRGPSRDHGDRPAARPHQARRQRSGQPVGALRRRADHHHVRTDLVRYPHQFVVRVALHGDERHRYPTGLGRLRDLATQVLGDLLVRLAQCDHPGRYQGGQPADRQHVHDDQPGLLPAGQTGRVGAGAHRRGRPIDADHDRARSVGAKLEHGRKYAVSRPTTRGPDGARRTLTVAGSAGVAGDRLPTC